MTYSSTPYIQIGFGIPSLDELIGRETNPKGEFTRSGIFVDQLHTTSICIIGPDGTGKSVLGLHLASRYAADCPAHIRVFYASTDLSFAKAGGVWQKFGLNYPNDRQIPFHIGGPRGGVKNVALLPHNPLEQDIRSGNGAPSYALSGYIAEGAKRGTGSLELRQVAFINLESATAGDDWGYLNRVLATLEAPKEGEPPHLLIIDAVEGLETLVGDLDAFGQKRSRRSRIAQILRTASKKCHLAFIVEEPADGLRLPEEFVTDVVMRLQTIIERDYSRRTVEIVKSRGQAHVRGKHTYVIRDGKGSVNGHPGDRTMTRNPDDPRVELPFLVGNEYPLQSYFHVFASLHSLTRRDMEITTKQTEQTSSTQTAEAGDASRQAANDQEMGGAMALTGEFAAGQPSTDQSATGKPLVESRFAESITADATPEQPMQRQERPADASESVAKTSDCAQFTVRGLEAVLRRPNSRVSEPGGFTLGTVNALIGDDGTHKSRMGRALLAGNFLGLTSNPQKPAVSILLTTHSMSSRKLCEKIADHLTVFEQGGKAKEQKEKEEIAKILQNDSAPCVLCRQLEVHYLSPAGLFHIVHSLIQHAKDLIRRDSNGLVDTTAIRLVIDDWSTIKDTFPDVAENALFLPFLVRYLKQEMITTLIIDTQPGHPLHVIQQEADRELRSLVNSHVYTWHVPFFGENRVAVAAIPPVTDEIPTPVRELRPTLDGSSETLEADPAFEMYMGLEEGKTELIPLSIRLHSRPEAHKSYFAETNALFRQLFRSRRGEGGEIIIADSAEEYLGLRDYSFLQSNTRLDHTLVYEVDEYWAQARSLHPVEETYLFADLGSKTNDPFDLFQESNRTVDQENGIDEQSKGASEQKKRSTKIQFFSVPGHDNETVGNKLAPPRFHDRIPFTWDFGFLLCQTDAWRQAFESPGRRKPTPDVAGDAWEKIRDDRPVTWREFFAASTYVAAKKKQDGDNAVYPFDVDMTVPETFSCLMLEVWASEIYISLGSGSKVGSAADVFPVNREQRNPQRGKSLPELLEQFEDELYCAWLLVRSVIEPKQFNATNQSFDFASRPSPVDSVATRHWYSTASVQMTGDGSGPAYYPIRLPGRYSVRGDWFLGIADNSRSPRVGYQAVDLLSSRRANILRLQAGLGLPTRDLLPQTTMGELRTALFALQDLKGKQIDYTIKYEELLKRGAGLKSKSGDEFFWLWRSEIETYDRHANIWNKWLYRLMVDPRMAEYQTDGITFDNFGTYDRARAELVAAGALSGQSECRGHFKNAAEFLKSVLQAATPD